MTYLYQTDEKTVVTKSPLKERQLSSFDLEEFSFIEAGSPPISPGIVVPNAESANPYKKKASGGVAATAVGQQQARGEGRLPPTNPQQIPTTKPIARFTINDNYHK